MSGKIDRIGGAIGSQIPRAATSDALARLLSTSACAERPASVSAQERVLDKIAPKLSRVGAQRPAILSACAVTVCATAILASVLSG
jgi:hypothetical protein